MDPDETPPVEPAAEHSEEAGPRTEHADAACPREPRAHGTVSVGLVLSAGGASAEAWHAGVLRALQSATGWDARGAELIAGTSAGAITGLCLRAGVPPADLCAHLHGEPLSDEGQAIIDRVVTPYREGHRGREWDEHGPQSPCLVARALWPPWQPRPLHATVGLLPRGARTTETLQQRLIELHPEPWPAQRLWVTAVRLSDGERVVFGRDDVQATAAEAVRASCAVPTRYEPVTVQGRRYVDGGVHSFTNADLMGPPAFDLVVVSSPMSGNPGWSRVRGALSQAWTSARSGLGLGEPPDTAPGRAWWSEALDLAWSDGRALRAARRHWVDDKLREEVHGLRRRNIAVLVVEPGPDAVEVMDADFPGPGNGPGSDTGGRGRDRRAEIADLADQTTRSLLAGGGGERLADLLCRASL